MPVSYTVGETARIAGVTIRTLRHYDRIGLLVPATRTSAGYRLYSNEDLQTLQLILFFRALDFQLETIGRMLRHPAHRRQEALELQADLLEKRADHYAKLARLARKTLAETNGGASMSLEESFDGLEPEQIMKNQEQYEEEVQARWGRTEAYRVSKKRVAGYKKEEWARIQQAAAANLAELSACYQAGLPADDQRLMAVCDQARAQINEFYYPCSMEIFAGLGQMYAADDRFAAFYNKLAEGLADYFSQAIAHYCAQSMQNTSESR